MTQKSHDIATRQVVIGLTGASGSGKSEAARILKGLGAAVIDADAVARAIVERREVLDELVEAFGDWVADGQGKFNRAAVSERAFSDAKFLERLTVITHKYIIKEICGFVDSLKSGGNSFPIVIDAPIPVERGFLDLSDTVWVIKAPRRRRLERVVARDKISAGAAEARFMSQLPDADYEKLADVLIENDGDLCNLENELIRQFNQLKEWS